MTAGWPEEDGTRTRAARDVLSVVGFVLWAASVLLVVGAFLVGLVVAESGPSGDTDEAWAPLVFPLISLAGAIPLGIAAIIVAAVSLARRRARRILAIVTIVLAVLPGLLVLALVVFRAIASAA